MYTYVLMYARMYIRTYVVVGRFLWVKHYKFRLCVWFLVFNNSIVKQCFLLSDFVLSVKTVRTVCTHLPV